MFGKKINVLIVGAKGQLGSYLLDFFNKDSMMKRSKFGKIFGVDRDELDICNKEAVSDFFNQYVYDPPVKFDYVINCAAATDTAAIEKDPTSYYAVNVLGAKHLAETCFYNKIKLIHISTDYVFSEYSNNSSSINLEPFPVNQYGLQKLLAEKFIETAYSKWPKGYLIARSSWMFGNSKKSFVEKLLSNIAKRYARCTYDEHVDQSMSIDVVNDCFGRPTPVKFIAYFIKDSILDKKYGICDCQLNAKQISRYDWAKIISDIAKDCFENGSLANSIAKNVIVLPVNSSKFVGMKHPGKISSLVEHSLTYEESVTEFKSWTRTYFANNIDMLKKTIEYAYNEEMNRLKNNEADQ